MGGTGHYFICLIYLKDNKENPPHILIISTADMVETRSEDYLPTLVVAAEAGMDIKK
jgi:hypothetical protein